MLKKLCAIVNFSAVALTACEEQQPIPAPEFSSERIKADMTFLASDEMEGREAGTPGYDKAAEFVANTMKDLGISPKGTNGYFQEIIFSEAALTEGSVSGQLSVNGTSTDLTMGVDYAAVPNILSLEGVAEGAFVFVGYGISAPTDGYDDLAGVDLTGKIVVFLAQAPVGLNSEIRAHFGRGSAKNVEFAKRGAVGSLMLVSDERFKRAAPFYSRPSIRWTPPQGGTVANQLPFYGVIPASTFAKIAAGTDADMDKINEALAAQQPLAMADVPKGAALNGTGRFTQAVTLTESYRSSNVVGVIEGTDLRDEYVVMSAHLDHVGVRKHPRFDDTDLIHNGALDNSSGIATMLELARAYQLTGKKPRRSILLTAVTAEEKGLLGAGYFANFPTVDKAALAANVNLDMPILLYDFQDVVAFGAERSDIGEITKAALARVNVALTPDPIPQQSLFVRSDHYEFIKQGIPSVFLMTGFMDTPDGESGSEAFQKFLTTNYHSPKDDVAQGIRFDVAAKFAEANYYIIDGLAEADERPLWKAGDFFGLTFGPANTAKAPETAKGR